MSERAKRCGTCGAWDERPHEVELVSVWYGNYAVLRDCADWGVCRRRHDDFPVRSSRDWCLDWLPREGE